MISSIAYNGDGSTRIFPVTFKINGEDYVRVYVDNVEVVDRTKYDIINNSIVFTSDDIPAVGTDNIKIYVATSSSELGDLGAPLTDITNVSNNLAEIVAVSTQVIPNLPEILLADNNATIATNQATIATNQATIATNQATIATTKASEAATYASNALTSENNAIAAAQAAGVSADEVGTWTIASPFSVATIGDLSTIDTNKYTTAIVKDLNRGGTFIWSATGTANGGTVFAGATGYWIRQYDGAVNVKWFGAVGDGITDDVVAIQSSIDFCISNNTTLYIEDGTYLCSKGLIVGIYSNGLWQGYSSITITGQKMGWYSEVGSLIGTTLKFTNKDTFGIAIQNCRNVTIENIDISGMNDYSSYLSGSYSYMMNNSNFVINGCRDSRYSPYTGIVIDPFTTSVPSDGGYPNMSMYYNSGAAPSSSIKFNSVLVKGFVVGICVAPNGTSALSSEITWKDCIVTTNKVGISICQLQSRNIYWYGGSVVWSLYCFDGNNYGQRAGYIPKIFGCNMTGKYLFNTNTINGQAMNISGIHAESFASIGFFGTPSTANAVQQPVVISSSEFALWDFGGIYADTFLTTNAPIKFIGCSFQSDSGYTTETIVPIWRFYKRRSGTSISFESCSLNKLSNQYGEFNFAPCTSSNDNFITGMYFKNMYIGDGSSRGTTEGMQEMSDFQRVTSNARMDRCFVFNGQQIFSQTDNTSIQLVTGSLPRYSFGSLAVTIGLNGTATFTVSDATLINTGTMVYTSTPINVEDKNGGTTDTAGWICIGVVSSISGNLVTIKGVPNSMVSGTYIIQISWWQRYHSTCTGNTTSGSTLISSVSNISAFAVGNRIQGTGIAQGTYIVSISGTDITISKAASATNTGVSLFDAVIKTI